MVKMFSKFEVSKFTHYKDMKGDAKYRNCCVFGCSKNFIKVPLLSCSIGFCNPHSSHFYTVLACNRHTTTAYTVL